MRTIKNFLWSSLVSGIVVFLVIIFVAWVYAKVKQRLNNQPSNRRMRRRQIERMLDESQIDDFDIQPFIDEIEVITAQPLCLIPPQVNGTCASANTQLGADGCCEIVAPKDPSLLEQTADFLKELALEELIAQSSEFLIRKVLSKAIQKASQRIIAKFGAQAVARKLTGRITARAAAKMVARLGARVAVRMARIGLRVAMALKKGPAAIVDVVSIIMDLIDDQGYGRYNVGPIGEKATPQGMFQVQLKAFAFGDELTHLNQNMDYPSLIPPSDLFASSEEWDAINASVAQSYVTDALDYLPDDLQEQLGDALAALIEDISADVDVPLALYDYLDLKVIELQNTDPIERDRRLFEECKKKLPSQKAKDLQLYTHMSTPRRSGLSLTQDAARRWNERYHTYWKQKNAAYMRGDPDIKLDYDQPYCAVFSDKYWSLDKDNPAPNGQPNMVLRQLVKPAPLQLFFGPLVAMCENADDKVDPYSLGVRMDYDNMRCTYNSQFCQRFGLDHENFDCKIELGQYILEALVGTSIVRGYKRRFQDLANSISNGDVLGMLEASYQLRFDPMYTKQNAINYFNRGDIIGGAIVASDPTGIANAAINKVHAAMENGRGDPADYWNQGDVLGAAVVAADPLGISDDLIREIHEIKRFLADGVKQLGPLAGEKFHALVQSAFGSGAAQAMSDMFDGTALRNAGSTMHSIVDQTLGSDVSSVLATGTGAVTGGFTHAGDTVLQGADCLFFGNCGGGGGESDEERRKREEHERQVQQELLELMEEQAKRLSELEYLARNICTHGVAADGHRTGNAEKCKQCKTHAVMNENDGCIPYEGTCENGRLAPLYSRIRENQCGACLPGYFQQTDGSGNIICSKCLNTPESLAGVIWKEACDYDCATNYAKRDDGCVHVASLLINDGMRNFNTLLDDREKIQLNWVSQCEDAARLERASSSDQIRIRISYFGKSLDGWHVWLSNTKDDVVYFEDFAQTRRTGCSPGAALKYHDVSLKKNTESAEYALFVSTTESMRRVDINAETVPQASRIIPVIISPKSTSHGFFTHLQKNILTKSIVIHAPTHERIHFLVYIS